MEPWPSTGYLEHSQRVDEVLRSGRLTLGENVLRFESRLAEHLGVDPRRVTMVASGTIALEMALRYHVRPGDVVVHPAIGFMASALAIRSVGAEIVWVDVDPHTGLIDPIEVELLLRDSPSIKKRIKAIVVVDVDGRVAPVEEIEEATGIPVIEDACAALGSSGPDGLCGTRGQAAALSFNATKILHTGGEGGAIVTADVPLGRWMRGARSFGERGQTTLRESSTWGTNAKPSEIAAAIGLVEIDALSRRIDQAKLNAEVLDLGAENGPLTPLPRGPSVRLHKYRLKLRQGVTRTRDSVERVLHGLGLPIMGPDVSPLPYHRAFVQTFDVFEGANQFVNRSVIIGNRDYPLWHAPSAIIADWVSRLAQYR